MSASWADVWVDYGVPQRVSNKAQMYVLTNEQINLIANLVTTTNDVFSFQIPMPFYIDQQRQAIVYERIDFMLRFNNVFSPKGTEQSRLQIDLQYSDKEPAADWNGQGEDVEDENIQAMFDGPMIIGENSWSGEGDTDATLAVMVPTVKNNHVHYYPPDSNGLDAFFPVTVVITNLSLTRDLVDQIGDKSTFTAFELFSMRCYFRVRDLTPRERALMTSEYYGLVPYS